MKLPKKKLKIAVFGQKRIPSREGGVEIVVEELATRVASLGNQVTVYNRSGHHVSGSEFDEKRLKSYKGIRIKTVPAIQKRGLAAVSSSFFASLCAAWGNYDVVHIHAEGPAFWCAIPKFFGKRVIVTIHGIDWARAKWSNSFGSKYIKKAEQKAVKHADAIIVLSKNVQDYFREQYNRETFFIPNGVNRPNLEEANEITERWGLKKDGYVLFLGRIVPEKGLKYLVDAWKDIKTDKKLVIAGGTSDTDDFAIDLKKNCGDNVIFTNFVQGQVLRELYSNAYVYTLPSDLEGMPLSLLEAMSYGNCCLTSDIPECAEVVEDKAVLFKKSDVADLREKLQNLLDHPEIVQKYKDEATEFICRKYNWDDVTRKTLALFRTGKVSTE
ncbi:glycosyltransferase family 4 protein [Anaerolactibacter massiliensis]|uniref:glycosyltransferase family 4 protein n=1 Tax=Anaerolactibacter massiliensis TaxID=2044573 RepID=UPI001EFC5EC1|nr:glycosyltransferase family 4 protein [Anaerolactibacter massiliensis]